MTSEMETSNNSRQWGGQKCFGCERNRTSDRHPARFRGLIEVQNHFSQKCSTIFEPKHRTTFLFHPGMFWRIETVLGFFREKNLKNYFLKFEKFHLVTMLIRFPVSKTSRNTYSPFDFIRQNRFRLLKPKKWPNFDITVLENQGVSGTKNLTDTFTRPSTIHAQKMAGFEVLAVPRGGTALQRVSLMLPNPIGSSSIYEKIRFWKLWKTQKSTPWAGKWRFSNSQTLWWKPVKFHINEPNFRSFRSKLAPGQPIIFFSFLIFSSLFGSE